MGSKVERTVGPLPEGEQPVILRLHPGPSGPEPIGATFRWSDGTGSVRIQVWTLDEWASMDPDERPRGYLDDTGRAWISLTDV